MLLRLLGACFALYTLFRSSTPVAYVLSTGIGLVPFMQTKQALATWPPPGPVSYVYIGINAILFTIAMQTATAYLLIQLSGAATPD